MRPTLFLPFFLSLAFGAANTLNITVINAQNNSSTLECWALEPGFQTSSQAGTTGTQALNLGPAGGAGTNATYTVLPAGFDGGRHNAPAKQWVIFISGLAHITLPNSTTEAWIAGGKYGAILALDTVDVSGLGHITRYPSAEETVAIQVPLGEGGVLPDHEVLYEGGCVGEEVSG
ncbi:uncharacterized protein N7496_005908 [Penicillium cataractarum]|uniref:Small secreted protein n=1 Tax=Penicillium cataractarum TaxID=2100454 RepID=A0A9W9S0R2_9EURO|nr:uncharacterized protein N7496_005908 [Penicillium cataractarum]KAJ5369816.1 hypothetical protein N7496_005908 [Penicillium cataractarum]